MPEFIDRPEQPASLLDSLKEAKRETAAASRPATLEPVQPRIPDVEPAMIQAQEILQPALRMVDEYIDEEVEQPGSFKVFFNGLAEKLKTAPENMGKVWRDNTRGIKQFIKTNWHEMSKNLGETQEEKWRKVMMVLLLAGVATVIASNWGGEVLDLFKKRSDGDGGSGMPTPEGQGEPQYDDYQIRALYSWQKYIDSGPIPGSMLDPMAIDDFETKLVTGYFPGWFCVPERVAICEQMIGEKLNLPDSKVDAPENPIERAIYSSKIKAERKVFFIEMQANWDKAWWPKVKNNPNLSQKVKNFYDPANRAKLREWYRQQYPITPTPEGSTMMRRTVADNMFLDFLASGKLIPNKPDILTYSHLLGSFVAVVYTAGAPILMPMTGAGFVAEEGGKAMKSGMLSGDVREAYKQIEIISRRPDSNLLDIAPHAKIINDYQQQIEIVRDLKPGSLGRL